jgi:hypothetical protein
VVEVGSQFLRTGQCEQGVDVATDVSEQLWGYELDDPGAGEADADPGCGAGDASGQQPVLAPGSRWTMMAGQPMYGQETDAGLR